MSIINDALKKTAESIQQNSNSQENVTLKPAEKKKSFLIYALIIATGIFLGNFALNMLAHKAKPAPITPIPQTIKVAAPQITAQVLAEQQPEAGNTENTLVEPAKEMERSDFLLSGVFFSDSEKYALLNNQIVKEGEMIRGATLKTITNNAVELEKQGQTLIISTNDK
ncbi:MAG: hypothetical protein WC561_01130 [Candidatus Omnitrophota bacterium]|jgi:hypothetical protein